MRLIIPRHASSNRATNCTASSNPYPFPFGYKATQSLDGVWIPEPFSGKGLGAAAKAYFKANSGGSKPFVLVGDANPVEILDIIKASFKSGTPPTHVSFQSKRSNFTGNTAPFMFHIASVDTSVPSKFTIAGTSTGRSIISSIPTILDCTSRNHSNVLSLSAAGSYSDASPVQLADITCKLYLGGGIGTGSTTSARRSLLDSINGRKLASSCVYCACCSDCGYSHCCCPYSNCCCNDWAC